MNILDPSALISGLLSLLPSSSQALESTHDGIAALIHSVFSALGFRLISVEDSSSPITSSSNVLPVGWNRNGPGYHTFQYTHNQSSLEFLIKIIKMGKRTVVSAIALESEKLIVFDFATDDFASPSFFPFDAKAHDASPLIHGFIASNRVHDFVSQLKLKIIQQLMPGLHKQGYAEDECSTNGPRASRGTGSVQPQPRSPAFESFRAPFSPRNPLEIGRSDLEPFGTFRPPSLFPNGGGDGMLVGPNHPIFGNREDQWRSPAGPSGRGPWGGDGFLPPLGAPLGARFDPVAPFSPEAPPAPGGRNLPGPDNDEFMPPGTRGMFM